MSAEFIAEEGALKGLVLSLDRGEEWSIGRDPEQVNLLVEDVKVSRKHLICRKTSEGYVIENLSITNPVLINDQPFTEQKLLQGGDKVTIGETIFHFYPEGAPTTYVFEPEYNFPPTEPFEDKLSPEEEKLFAGEESFAREEEEILDEESSSEEEEILDKETSQIPEEEEELDKEEVFQEIEGEDVNIDLTLTTRFIIKVIAGPNTGAEFALDLGRNYLIGTDPATCDLIFNDLSVSREHARLSINKEAQVVITDLQSRNGVIVDKERITEPKMLVPNSVVAFGTSAFLLIDREAPSETIVAPIFEPSPEEKVEEEESKEEIVKTVKKPMRPIVATGPLILALVVVGLVVLLGIGMVSLLQTEDVVTEKVDYLADIQNVMKDFPAVRFTYNRLDGKLFLVGHVETAVQLNELLYKLRGLLFIRGVENNIVNDEAVWQEVNILLSKISEFKGVSMHSPKAGVFIISGYLKADRQASDLIDYLNINFNYLNLLQNHVIVEEQVVSEVSAHLQQHGFEAVTISFAVGELLLTGYVSSTQTYEYESLVNSFEKIPGLRAIKNFVVTVSPEQGVIDLNKRYPGKYHVTGFSKHGDVNINVVMNGKILTRGDQIDEMTITSIQPNAIFLEKDGLKYKIEYNK